MEQEKTRGFTPQKMRALLIFTLIFVALGSGGVFYLGLEETKKYGTEVNHRLLDADASYEQLSGLQALKNQLAESENLVAKANRLFATPDNYQNEALSAVRNYADVAGLTITNTRFADAADGSKTIVLSFNESSVTYSSIIYFLQNIEENVPKLQVMSLPVSSIEGGGSNSIKIGDVVIKIYVRQ